jgi:hypothetical protein
MPPWPKAVKVDFVCGAVTCRKVGDGAKLVVFPTPELKRIVPATATATAAAAATATATAVTVSVRHRRKDYHRRRRLLGCRRYPYH